MDHADVLAIARHFDFAPPFEGATVIEGEVDGRSVQFGWEGTEWLVIVLWGASFADEGRPSKRAERNLRLTYGTMRAEDEGFFAGIPGVDSIEVEEGRLTVRGPGGSVPSPLAAEDLLANLTEVASYLERKKSRLEADERRRASSKRPTLQERDKKSDDQSRRWGWPSRLLAGVLALMTFLLLAGAIASFVDAFRLEMSGVETTGIVSSRDDTCDPTDSDCTMYMTVLFRMDDGQAAETVLLLSGEYQEGHTVRFFYLPDDTDVSAVDVGESYADAWITLGFFLMFLVPLVWLIIHKRKRPARLHQRPQG